MAEVIFRKQNQTIYSCFYLMKLKAFLLTLVTLSAALMAQANPADFTIQSVHSTNTFHLADAKGKFVAVHFLLKTECPYCVKHTVSYLELAKTDTNVVHIFLKPDTEAEIKHWAGRLPAEEAKDAPLYRDPEAKLAQAFNIPDGYAFHGQTVHYPALVILDPQGKEVFRYVGKSNADRYSTEKFTAKMGELTKKPAAMK